MNAFRLSLVVTLLAAILFPLPANGGDRCPWGFFPTPNLPPPSEYVSRADWHAYYANGIYIDDIRHHGFTENFPPPLPGNPQIEQFGSVLDLVVYVPGYGSIPAHITNVPVSVWVSWAGEAGGITDYATEMLSLNVNWNSPLGPVLIRESPTLVSLGLTRIQPSGGGYMIDSFFDIFTELSLDGGQSWVPSTNPNGDHMGLIPEPAALALLAVGGLLLRRR